MQIGVQTYPYPEAQDALTKSINTIDFAHSRIHSGKHFSYCDSVTLGSGAIQDYLITVPAGVFPHLIYFVDGTAVTTIELFEATDKIGTTLQAIFNSNRNSVTTSGVTIHKAVTGGTTDGMKLCMYSSGTATNQSRSSSSQRNESEIILKQNTKYILRVTSGTAGNLTNTQLFWYEN